MTYAICIRCGHPKIGALVPCHGCGFDPKDPQDAAKSIMLSDQVLGRSDLEAMADRLKRGEPLTFDPQDVERVAEVTRQVGQETKKLKAWALGCAAVVAITGAVAVLMWLR